MMRLIFKLAYKILYKKVLKKDQEVRLINLKRDNIDIRVVNYLFDDKKEHQMNVLRRKGNDKKAPIFFDIHGGGWMYGDKDTNLDYGKFFADKSDAVVFLPSYSLTFTKRIDGIIQELFKAIEYVINNSERLNVDLNNFYLTGDSAGGQLAVLILAINQSTRLQEVYKVKPLNLKVKKVILTAPCCYIEKINFVPQNKFVDKHARDTFNALYYGRDYLKGNRLTSNASLKDIISEIKELPPILITSSSGDKFMGYQSDLLVKDLKKHNFKYEYYYLFDETMGHVANVLNPDKKNSLIINDRVLDFIK